MRLAVLAAAVSASLAVVASAQTSMTPRSPRPEASGSAAPAPPPPVAGYVLTVEIRATAPQMDTPASAAPEVRALGSRLKNASSLTSRIYLAQDLSRQEIVSTDFVLPAGTLVMHKAGDRFYVIADPKEKTYLVMDAEALLDVLEGGAGVVNSQYEARVQHTDEHKTIAGVPCRKSVVTVTYISSIPLENERVAVQQRNDIEVWHTSLLVSSAATDHFFFKYQRDRTGQVQKAVSSEIGFPMEVNLVVTQGTGKKSAGPAPGSLHMVVTEVRKDSRLDSEMFRIPPAGYRRIEKSPYFAAGAMSEAGARIAREGAPKQ
jgi:hypothetical protein